MESRLHDKTVRFYFDAEYERGYTLGMKTAISVPEKVFRSADTLAKRMGVSRSQLYSTAVAEFLARHQGRQITAKLNALYEEEDSSLSTGFSQMQAASLGNEEW